MGWTEEEYAAYLQRTFTGPQGAITTYGTSQPPDEPEASLQARILRLARAQGWLCYHTRDSRGSAEGFPDLVLVREAIIFAELKTRTGKLTTEQARWLIMLGNAQSQVEVYCWRPADWPAIAQRLTQPWRDET